MLPIGSRRRTLLFAKCSMCPRACIQAGPANQDNGGSAPDFRQHPPSPRSTVSTASLRTTFTSGSTSCDAQFSNIRTESFCCARGYAEILSAFEVGQNGPWSAGYRCLWSLHATLLCLYVLYCVSCGSRAAFVSAIAYRDTDCLCCLSSEPQCEGSRNM